MAYNIVSNGTARHVVVEHAARSAPDAERTSSRGLRVAAAREDRPRSEDDFEEKTATGRVFEIRFGTGDEILTGLYDFVAKNKITTGHITGIGGLAPGALLGWGDPEVGAFKRIEIKDKTEIVSLIGDISSPNGKPYVHVHMVVGSADGTTKAGHLLEAHIAPVGELTVVATGFAAK